MLTITNTLSAKKEQLKPLYPHKVTLYVCGITPYDFSHVGHARVYIIFDLLYRFLTFLDYTVIYCRNFTDIDDKLLARAQKEYGDKNSFLMVASQFIQAFQEDMAALNCLPPTFQPRVTEHIPEIVTFIKKLVDTGKAYEADGDVYFSIQSFPDYGHLSKQKLEDLRVGARVEPNQKKRDPLDFALWKSEPEGTFWKSPWGYGRPGWHIECSALARHFLGEHVDIHGGGMDLMFPHHENEIAQSESVWPKPFARYWMHNAFVRIDKEKMSKSLANFFTIREVIEKFDPMVLRFLILNHYYRAPLDFSLHDLEVAQKTYQKLCIFFSKFECKEPLSFVQMKRSEVVQKMVAFLSDDLNTPGMFGVIFENLKDLANNPQQACEVKAFIIEVLGLKLVPLPEKEVVITAEIQQLLEEREHARAAKDWKKSDELREKLKQLGYEVQDGKTK
jgi:cysteinyl-tRNA synthetase